LWAILPAAPLIDQAIEEGRRKRTPELASIILSTGGFVLRIQLVDATP
jgi:hypothetical protein